MSEQGGSTVRSLRKLLVLVSMVVVLSMLSMGVAFAHPSGAEHAFVNNGLDNSAPVGSNFFDPTHPGMFKGFDIGNAVAGITRNPLCPLHHAQHAHP